MPSPSAWRELASQFKRLERESGSQLAARWTSARWDAENNHWYITGAIPDKDRHIFERFRAVAERGAVLHRGEGDDSLGYWLDLLREHSPHFRSLGADENPDESDRIDFGGIENVCAASADYCYRLETVAISQEQDVWKPVGTPIGNLLRRKMSLPLSPKTPIDAPRNPRVDPIADQLDGLRQECRWTAEYLAEMVGRDVTTVYRHLSGVMIPALRTIGAYEREFSKELNRKVVIRKTPGKRQ